MVEDLRRRLCNDGHEDQFPLFRLSAAAINRYLAETNNNPKPFTWTTDPDAIIEKVRRGKQALESIHSHVRHYQTQASEFVAYEQARVLGSSGQGRRHGRRNDG